MESESQGAQNLWPMARISIVCREGLSINDPTPPFTASLRRCFGQPGFARRS